MKSLYKTVAVIWSEEDGSQIELIDLAQAATDGTAYCSRQASVQVADPTADPDWDGTEFFSPQEH